jgi:general stress protein 26
MGEMNLQDVAKKMKDIDFVMLQTRTEGGEIAGRPMSNNGDVEYDGDSFFFASEGTRLMNDISREPKVSLAMQGSKGLLGKPPIFISIEGDAEIIRDKAMFGEHWTSDLERWWKDGIDSPGLALIKVHASRIHYWDGEDQGEIRLS